MRVAHPIATGKQALPRCFNAKMLIGLPNGEQGVRGLVSPDRLLNQRAAQRGPYSLHVKQGFRQQNCIRLCEQLRWPVNMTFDGAAAGSLVPLLEWLLESVQPEIIVDHEVAGKNSRLRP